MKKLKKNILLKILIGGLFLLPFTDLPYFKNLLREVSGEGAFYLFFPMVVLTFFYKSQEFEIINHKSSLNKVGMIFLLYVLLVFVINFNVIIDSSLMGKNGTTRFLLQFFELLFGVLIVYSFGKIINSEQKFALVINLLATFTTINIIYALFQFFVFHNGGIFLNIYKSIGKLIYDPVTLEITKRVYGFGSEPSHLAFYFTIFMPYAIIIFIKNKKYVLLLLLGVVVILTFSRTLYVTFLVESFVIIFFTKYNYYRFSKLILYLPIMIVVSVIIYLTPVADVFASVFNIEESASSNTRFIVSFVTIQAFLENNIFFGLGLGQAGFFTFDYLASFAKLGGEFGEVLNYERWPFIHNLHIRILAETGLIGFALWGSFFILILRRVNMIIKEKYYKSNFQDVFGHAVIASVIGLFIACFSRENLTNMNVWVAFGLAFTYISLNLEHLKSHHRTKSVFSTKS